MQNQIIRLSNIVLCLFAWFQSTTLFAQPFSGGDIAGWKSRAQNVTIIRDNWGIPHVYGKSDADAVFGLLYAQCEDDFQRVEANYIEKLGRRAEVEGEKMLASDLLIKLIIDSADAVQDYNSSPKWLHKLLDAFADGVNYYLYSHPEAQPKLLTRFKPWYPLLWTDGSIGAISTANMDENDLKGFYGVTGNHLAFSKPPLRREAELPTGSNGFAFGPKITASGNSILYINPHVTLYFRPEVQMVSDEGLNVYGAVTWGQFFVYQGFNEHCGWMHTSSEVDVADAYLEKVSRKGERWYYEYNNSLKPVESRKIRLNFLKDGEMGTDSITGYYTLHGPVMGKEGDRWITVRSYNRSMKSLIQSWQRTKSKSFADYKEAMNLLANTSNNTVYADAEGNIAYWHGNFVPRRDTAFDWNRPVDGTSSATEWKGLHSVKESVHIYNPPTGWLQNCNSTPFTVAGEFSPKEKNYPRYMAPDGENFRGINAVRVLQSHSGYTLDKVIAAGYDRYLSAFEVLIPALIKASADFSFDSDSAIAKEEIRKEDYLAALDILKSWDLTCDTSSVATALAVEWGTRLLPEISTVKVPGNPSADFVERTRYFATHASPTVLVAPFLKVLVTFTERYGTWKIAWGEINRFQRLTDGLQLQYDDSRPSLPVPFVSSVWGMLPSYSSYYFAGTRKRYGDNGNSFICAVEFGKRIKAKSLLAGGESGHKSSPHFTDQALMYTEGTFKDVFFYKEDVVKHAEKTYHPGEE